MLTSPAVLILGGILLISAAAYGIYQLWPSSAPAAVKEAALPAAKEAATAPPPVSIREGTPVPVTPQQKPAGSLGEAFTQATPIAQPAPGQPSSTLTTSTPQPAATPVTPTKPSPVDVSRTDLKPVDPTSTAGTATLPPTVTPGLTPSSAANSITPTTSTNASRAQVEAADRALAANKPLEARTALSRALFSTETARADQEMLRQRLATLNQDLVFSSKVTPGDPLSEMYTVVGGDALEKIRRKRELTTEWMLIQRINKLASPDSLKIGQKLKLVRGPFHAIVHKANYRVDVYAGSPDDSPESWLYIRSFKAGMGADNGTPLGVFKVRNKMQNPGWTNPRTGAKFDADDPANPIGEYWLGLVGQGDSAPITGYGLHGTIEPASVGQQLSMGCVRLLDEDIELLYELLAPKISIVKILP